MTVLDPEEVLAVVARRGHVLRAVGTDGVSKRDLVDSLSVSRSTIDRSIRELEAVGFLERATDSGYRRTLPGRLALEEYQTFTDRMNGLVSSVDVLSLLPVGAPCDAKILDDATVVLAERHSPHVPINHLSDLVRRATTVWAIAPAVLPQQVAVYHERLTSGDLTARIVVTDAVVERMLSAYSEQLRDTLATGNLEVLQTEESIPYSLVAAETPEGPEMGLLVYGDSGVRGFIGNDDSEAVEWAHEQVESYLDTATPLPTAVDGDR